VAIEGGRERERENEGERDRERKRERAGSSAHQAPECNGVCANKRTSDEPQNVLSVQMANGRYIASKVNGALVKSSSKDRRCHSGYRII